jgi:SAM-dependent methyltransferase
MSKDSTTTENSTHNYYKTVQQHREEYFRRPALQAVYKHWAERVCRELSQVDGKSVELGCGCGALSQHLDLVKTDIYKHDWVDEVVDACDMSYDDGECANLVAVDVLHHLPEPTRFFDEANRVLAKGGRLILLEPYISFFSYFIYRFLHHEPLDLKACPFEETRLIDEGSGEVCNIAIPTLMFVRSEEEFSARWPELNLISLDFSDFLVYPMTGGFSHRSLLPARWMGKLMRMEDKLLQVSGRFLGIRMLVVMQKG